MNGAHNGGGGNFLQTPDFILFKEHEAKMRIGKYLLIAAFFKGGVVIGHRFKPRQQKKQQWLYLIDKNMLVVGWGTNSAFKAMREFIYNLGLGMKHFLSEDCITLPYLYKNISETVRAKFEEKLPFALDLLFADIERSAITVVDFKGEIENYYGFCVLGGYGYEEEKIKGRKMLPATDPQGMTVQLPFDEIEHIQHFPRKKAVEAMQEYYGERAFLLSGKEAEAAVRAVLFEHDPPSKSEVFEITTIRGGRATSIYPIRTKSAKSKSRA